MIPASQSTHALHCGRLDRFAEIDYQHAMANLPWAKGCRRGSAVALTLLLLIPSVQAAREFREYPGLEADAAAPLPADYRVPGEFVVGRLMFPSAPGGWFGRGDWTQGGTAWAVDYPKGDRFLARILRRLTRINTRSVEQPVNLDDGDDVFDWPFLVAGLPGMWDLTDAQVEKLRSYLLRGGFLLCDSFFGTREWEGFVRGMQRIFPDRQIIDLPDGHPLLHTVYDLGTHGMVPNMNALMGGVPYRADGDVPHWRAILDDHGRAMVVISFNNDLGDSWQWADNPDYPEGSASLGVKMSVNFVVYAMTH
jgi:hypothetical protein